MSLLLFKVSFQSRIYAQCWNKVVEGKLEQLRDVEPPEPIGSRQKAHRLGSSAAEAPDQTDPPSGLNSSEHTRG